MCLLGDFNARTGHLSDLIHPTDNDDDVNNFVNICEDNVHHGISHAPVAERVNSDSIVNNTGRRLIKLCRSLDMLIMNGGFGKDVNVGNKTCKNSSTVDYIIIAPSCIESILDFEILDFNPLISDVHCPVYADFKIL